VQVSGGGGGVAQHIVINASLLMHSSIEDTSYRPKLENVPIHSGM